jgi:hypothetical protein
MKVIQPLCLTLCLSLCALGCGGGGGSSNPSNTGVVSPIVTPQNADVSGPWQTTATSTSNPGSTAVIVEANLSDTGGSVSSTAFVVVNSCVSSDANSKVSGTVSVNTVTLTATYGGVSVSLTGTVSGSTISGTYTASGVCGLDTGTWTATKMPLINGNYSGNVFSNSNSSQAIPVTASVSADASFKITGNASVSSTCFNQLALNGTQVGGAGQFIGTDAQGDSVTFLFISKDAAFGTISGIYSVTAGPTTCNGDSGTGTLNKM